MTDIERKAAFYLGRVWDIVKGQALEDQPVMYDARDLTTHAVCIGMTGSGKTGLGVTLLEEAALDGIPSIVIDPKGDMTNLLLTFPELRPTDFEPWVNLDDARRKGQTPSEFAAATAASWAKGLAGWQEDGERIRRLKESAEFAIYTPGSDAGLQVSVLQNLKAPGLSWDDDEETLREMIGGTVSGLLGLVGVEADPIQSREHILMSHIFEQAWRRGEDLDLAKLIQAIQQPPVKRLGVFDVDTFYPEKERFALAMALNRVVAAPSFEYWLEGAPLDIAQVLHTPEGKPRVAVFYIAHLSDAERMFFVTLLLQQVLGWMRRQSGTTSLRALLYFDELFGYFPPHPANPPCKTPLLSLLKQARAFGLGLILTTQNPVDLDYKGLTNAGTWFIGKLQTDRDKARVLEGMEGVVTQAGTLLDRNYLDRMISSLTSRVFILHNVHADKPIVYTTRWAMSYLRGPLTRSQVRELMAPFKTKAQPAPTASSATAAAPESTQRLRSEASVAPTPEATELPAGYTPIAPRINARLAQYYLGPSQTAQQVARNETARARRDLRLRSAQLVYEPYLLAVASVLFADAQRAQTQTDQVASLLPLPKAHEPVRWEQHGMGGFDDRTLARDPEPGALYGELPEGMGDTPPYTELRADFVDYIYREYALPQWTQPALRLTSRPGETREAFVVRCQSAVAAQRDAELEKARERGKTALARLQDKLDRVERAQEDQEITLRGRRQEEGLAGVGTVLGTLLDLGRGKISAAKIRRLGTGVSSATRRRRMTSQTKANLEQAQEQVDAIKREIAAAQQDQDAELEQVRTRWEAATGQIEDTPLHPRKTDIRPDLFGLLWAPHWLLTLEDERGAQQETVVPAFEVASATPAGR